MQQNEQTTIALDQVKFDSDIYPRQRWSTATIERYMDAMQAGAEFPPIVLEAETRCLLDGKHRLEAYKRRKVAQVPVEYRVVPEGMSPRYYAATLSSAHGDRLSNADLKLIAEAEFEVDPTLDPGAWGQRLGITGRTVYRWVSHIIRRDIRGREIKVWRLVRLGWPQHEIAERLGVSQQTISEDTRNCHLSKIGEILGPDWNDKGLAEEANRVGLPLLECYAAAMDGMDDAERMERLDITVQPYDVWTFQQCHDLFGDAWPGRIPGQLVAHVLCFWTKPGQWVFDPMAGSGTTPDVCLALGRKCYAYDLNLEHDRPDIRCHNLHTDGWPETLKKAHLIFWDPPYFDKKAKEYVDGSISALDREAYLEVFREAFAQAYATVRRGTRLAFLMSHWNDENGKAPFLPAWHYAQRMEAAGWTVVRCIDCPLSTQQVHPDIVVKFRAAWRLARLSRSLIVAEKR